ncbi:MAG: hypothetical protein JSU07_03235 [Bacteroidetes bacterium]|nr:hypothetical protein [Bacteroidota bacterium]
MAEFTLLSSKYSTTSSIKSLYYFLIDFKNFKAILPEDKIENFEYKEDECSFNIRGITPLHIKIIEKSQYRIIKYSSEGLSKFNFQLHVKLNGNADEKGECEVYLLGDLNPIIKSMAEKPLQNLINTMSQKLSELNLA